REKHHSYRYLLLYKHTKVHSLDPPTPNIITPLPPHPARQTMESKPKRHGHFYHRFLCPRPAFVQFFFSFLYVP
ncbi:hypothetical protein, partial [Salmonella sp. s39606]|uniref:hypothetical protein n=1 Tax=Salmonella sp. s39606 TaxID=3159643 RepID=UPI00397F0744